MADLAFKASYSDWKLIKTRGVVQVVMEVPLSDANAAYNVLGGMPDASREIWFAIAPLKLPQETKEVVPNPNRSEQSSESGRNIAQPQPKDKPAGAKLEWRELQPAAQAGIRCDDPVFQEFLKDEYYLHWIKGELDTAVCVRLICGVESRSQLGTNQKARILWHQLDEHFQAWKLIDA